MPVVWRRNPRPSQNVSRPNRVHRRDRVVRHRQLNRNRSFLDEVERVGRIALHEYRLSLRETRVLRASFDHFQMLGGHSLEKRMLPDHRIQFLNHVYASSGNTLAYRGASPKGIVNQVFLRHRGSNLLERKKLPEPRFVLHTAGRSLSPPFLSRILLPPRESN